ncbi:hypothetical protein B0H12DRAFT_1120858 [Mycena haematopus]|nr:hypothetical protein B0H12DRAFT_1120858 [Mycena haematopus]
MVSNRAIKISTCTLPSSHIIAISSETSSSPKSHTRTSSSTVHTLYSCMMCSHSTNSTYATPSSPAANFGASCLLGGTPSSAQAGTMP